MKTGPKITYNLDLVLADYKEGLSNKEVAQKHNLSYRVAANIKSRYINGKVVKVPSIEKCARKLEKLQSLFGEEIFKEAISYFV